MTQVNYFTVCHVHQEKVNTTVTEVCKQLIESETKGLCRGKFTAGIVKKWHVVTGGCHQKELDPNGVGWLLKAKLFTDTHK